MVRFIAGPIESDRASWIDLKVMRPMESRGDRVREWSVTAAAVLAMAGLLIMMLATALSVMGP
ncbi:hypothetical protein SAE02_57410 [Skermanella aerolata]|uniref:Uncharacterized protein n=1 Tax=Skermanella aerolata TaxID=393310 RepID=A0A512DYM4_9PROT|nr:hypothetical protein N826_18675 [Skermanella aerolata KACC 11604]GEO41593.1 hypothetical protein SAE02_57410 [Skermanella aerolata]